ncbi:MAG: hypothetical protein LBJ17_06335 [Dysgonamonadaceae bacterium]|jgi:hypothetical protein|nr:hypothetical protein [Dysgonamonadaceae bacterium]
MNKIKFFMLALTVCGLASLSSCTDSEDVPMDLKLGKIVRSNLNEVKYVYRTSSSLQTSSSLRSSSGDANFGAIDINGIVTEIKFLSEDGEFVGSSIPPQFYGMAEIGDEFVICGVMIYQDFKKETDSTVVIGTAQGFRELLINKRTGAVYTFPENTGSIIRWNRGSTDVPVKGYFDSRGNLYICYSSFYSGKFRISKIDIQNPDNVTIEDYLPPTEMENLDVNISSDFDESFMVSASGTCAYRTRGLSGYRGDFKFKCSGGRIYPISQLIPEASNDYGNYNYNIFLGHSGSFYITIVNSYRFEIHKLFEPTTDELAIEKVAELNQTNTNLSFSELTRSIANPVTYTRIWSLSTSGKTGKIVEFNETTNILTLTEFDIPRLYNAKLYHTSDGIYISSTDLQKQTKIHWNDYSNQTTFDFRQLGYEAYTLFSTTASPELSFTALRYSDASYIIGIVDATGNINCLESIPFINEQTQLIRVN